jgi:TPR repeat protein
MPRPFVHVLVLVLVHVLAACNRGAPSEASDPNAQPLPSASVVQIANEPAGCDDVEFCARACDAGTADSCRRLATSYETGKGVSKDEARAVSLFDQACTLGDPPACMSAGRMYEFHHGVAKDDAKAASYYKRGCDIGFMASCANYAIMLENGRGVAKDLPAALAIYERACKAGAGLACERVKVLKPD